MKNEQPNKIVEMANPKVIGGVLAWSHLQRVILSHYVQEHSRCPECWSDNVHWADGARFLGEDADSTFDGNVAICHECRWQGIRHDLVSDDFIDKRINRFMDVVYAHLTQSRRGS